MILLDTAMILEAFTRREGFAPHVRDLGALESAVHRQHSAMYGHELYPTLDLKVAALMDGIARSHPLYDGNKRLAYLSARLTFWVNGRRHRAASVDETHAFILRISGEHMEVPEIAERLAAIFTRAPDPGTLGDAPAR